ncbi:unnamed protein product [Soboliphyme baturini]|uniref:Band_3_cyto domain-containing protein n=1 Tax=Soboliphyme baturini TaxID=241478 RepID=A0A183IRE8_9BILA|nr:unnamed protein product [Soboliphyme baturini]
MFDVYLGPLEVLHYILEGDEGDVHSLEAHPLFSELLFLESNCEDETADECCWVERSRWLKFEERAELDSGRWSKPLISLLSFQSLQQLRGCFKKSAPFLQNQVTSFNQLAEQIVENLLKEGDIQRSEAKICKECLQSPKKHLVGSRFATGINDEKEKPQTQEEDAVTPSFSSKLESKEKHVLTSILSPHPPSNILRKLPKDVEGACILIGYIPNITRPVAQFVRLEQAQLMPDLLEVPIPTRFVFVLFVPIGHVEQNAVMIGRCLGALFVDEVRED